MKYQVLWLMKTNNPTKDFWLVCLYDTMSCRAICYLWIFEMKWALVGNRAERFPAEEAFSELRPCLRQHFLIICLIQSQCIQSVSSAVHSYHSDHSGFRTGRFEGPVHPLLLSVWGVKHQAPEKNDAALISLTNLSCMQLQDQSSKWERV